MKYPSLRVNGRLVLSSLMAGGVAGIICLALGSPARLAAQGRSGVTVQPVRNAKYVILAWNDLGMHCINPRFAQLAVLPPFNSLWVQVVKRGAEPDIVRSNIHVFYTFPENRTTAGKSDFWKYEDKLFGVNLPEGTGLTGSGLTGEMRFVAAPYPHYEATGIPVLPISDNGKWNPYQQAVITVTDQRRRTVLARALVTAPVSDEMRCDNCHSDGGVGGFRSGTVDGNILMLHDREHGTRLIAQQPVLCAKCHQDEALGAPGTPGVPSLSEAMHTAHGKLPAEKQPKCYECHPGPMTQCNRSAIQGMGPKSPTDPNCEHCHGSLLEVGTSIAGGRRPWLDEPECGSCHRGPEMDTAHKLYRHSTGHGGIACEACHNSPHAWYPSLRPADNWQPLTYQGDPGPIGKSCAVCHTNRPDRREGPHTVESEKEGQEDRQVVRRR